MMETLRKIWRAFYAGWMRFAHVLGVINTTILLTLVYAIMVLPMRGIAFMLRKDPLRLRSFRAGATWQKRRSEPEELRERTHPF